VVDLAEPRWREQLGKPGHRRHGRTRQRAACELKEITTPHGSPQNQKN